MSVCVWCESSLPDGADKRQRYCSPACRNAANNAKAKARPVADDEHGKRIGYARGCRCQACRDYNANYSRQVRARQPKGPRKRRSDAGTKRGPTPHGTVSGYTFHGCRCDACRRAKVSDNAEWRDANGEVVRHYFRQYRRANPDKIKGYAAARAAAPFDADALTYSVIIGSDPCSYCGSPSQAVDHIDPVSVSKNSRWDNLTAACTPCNARKGAKRLLRFLHDVA